MRRGQKGRNSKKKKADYGVVIHIKPDDKKPVITILWRLSDGTTESQCCDKDKNTAVLNMLNGWRDSFKDVHENGDTPAPPLDFTFEELVSCWCAIFPCLQAAAACCAAAG